MRKLRNTPARLFVLALLCALFPGLSSFAAAIQRVANTTIAMPAAPPVSGYTWTNAFGNMTFTNPVCLATPPGETNRIFIVEKSGDIVVITNLASPNRTVFLNITPQMINGANLWSDEGGLLGLAFHPGYATNGYFYIFYTGVTNGPVTVTNDILARYQVSQSNSNQANPNSAVVLFAQYDRVDNHNAGDLHFGPDGYLYVGLGDEGMENNVLGNAQVIDKNFFSGIIRIDVDMLPGNLPPNPHVALLGQTNYLVPNDNPFIGITNFNGTNINTATLRTEFWAVGLRNPWRFSFDTDGTLYCGDVGEYTCESVDIITKGANFGWAWYEGTVPFSNTPPAGFVHAWPLLGYFHTNGAYNAVIGGIVYRGVNLSQLYGSYVYGNSGGGDIWALTHSGTNVTANTLLFTYNNVNASGYIGLSTFGVDPRNGDILFGDVYNSTNGVINRIIYNSSTNGAPIPPMLSQTGVFSNVSMLTPNAGIVPYTVNVPFWSDNAIKSRWFSLTNTNTFFGFNSNGPWSLPVGSIWIKHFELQTNSSPPMTIPVETRVLVCNSNGVYGVTYRWGGSTNDASLVAEGGMDDYFVINNGGVITTQDWHYPARSECLQCHTGIGGLALGFNTAQLNCAFTYSNGVTTNQIKALSDAGYFTSPVSNINVLPALVPSSNNAVSLDYRVRSYLAANCSQCHQPGGNAMGALWDARISTLGPQCGIINGPLADNLGNTNNVVVAPGSLTNSILYYRVANMGTLHMPPLATFLVNTDAVQLLSNWISGPLVSYQTYNQWSASYFGTNTANTGLMQDYDGDGAVNYMEYLADTDPTNPLSYWTVGLAASGGSNIIQFLQRPDRGYEVQKSFDLVNWFPLDVPANAPLFSIGRLFASVPDLITTNTAYYRVRIFEP